MSDSKSLVIWVPIHNSRVLSGLGWSLSITGWMGQKTLKKRITDAVRACQWSGITPRVLLQLPFGDDGKGAMDFTSRLGLWSERGKAVDFRKWCKWFQNSFPNTELIVRLGNPQRDPLLENARENGEISRYRSLWHRSLLSVPDWASLAVDSTEELAQDHPAAALLEYERSIGRTVYSEPIPLQGSAVADWPYIFRHSLGANGTRRPQMRIEDTAGEKISFNLDRNMTAYEGVAHMDDCYSRGWTPSLGYGIVPRVMGMRRTA